MGLLSDWFRGKDNVNTDDEDVQSVARFNAKPAVPQSQQVSSSDIANAYMLEGMNEGGETSRGLDYDQLLSMTRVPLSRQSFRQGSIRLLSLRHPAVTVLMLVS